MAGSSNGLATWRCVDQKLTEKKNKINHRTDEKLVSGRLGQGNGCRRRREGLYHRAWENFWGRWMGVLLNTLC